MLPSSPTATWRPVLRRRTALFLDRVLASDPGLARLSSALGATLGMAAALLVEYLLGRATGAPPQGRLVAMLIGAVVAMMGSMALTGTGVWRKVRVAVFFPVAIGAGLTAGAAVAGHRALMLGGFVLVMFLAVYVRRFGLPFFFYGFMLWMGYFFASFLKLTLPLVPQLLVAVVAATLTVLLLAVTVLRTNPRGVLRSTWRAYVARGRALAAACSALLRYDAGDPVREAALRRRVAARQAGLAEAGLMVEGWSEEPGALADGWSGNALRRHAIDVQQTLDRAAAASAALAASVDRGAPVVVAAADALDEVAAGHQLLASAAVVRLESEAVAAGQGPVAAAARRLAAALREHLDLVHGEVVPPRTPDHLDFEPATALMMGNLPGSPSVASDVAARGGRWNPVVRLDLTTRQAVQASLAGGIAIAAGTLVSPTRYYWAVIAAFVVFTGTSSRSETFLKASNRVVGTLVGLVASILLAHLTHGATPWVLTVVLLSMFLGFYLVRVSYVYMIFFVTIMLGQLYSALHTFSSGLLVLRLEETAVGAAVGVAVALLVTPLSTRDTARAARDNLLTALAELLEGVAGCVCGTGELVDLDAALRGLDNRVRQLLLVARPLTRPLVWGNHSPRTRHRLQLYSDTAVHARALVTGLRRTPGMDAERVAAACRALAGAAGLLTAAGIGRPLPDLGQPLTAAEKAVGDALAADAQPDPVLRPLHHLHRTLAELGGVAETVAS